MTNFSTNPYFIFQLFECYTTLIIKQLFYNKIKLFTSISKCFVTYITITVTNILNNNKAILKYNEIVQSPSYCQKETVPMQNQCSYLGQFYHA